MCISFDSRGSLARKPALAQFHLWLHAERRARGFVVGVIRPRAAVYRSSVCVCVCVCALVDTLRVFEVTRRGYYIDSLQRLRAEVPVGYCWRLDFNGGCWEGCLTVGFYFINGWRYREYIEIRSLRCLGLHFHLSSFR